MEETTVILYKVSIKLKQLKLVAIIIADIY